MKDKYYIPDITEFHVGFEYEIENIENSQWGSIKQSSAFGAFDDDIDDLEEGRIRVKYLDKSDIEELGWEFVGGKLIADFLDTFEKDNYILEYKYDSCKLTIIYNNPILFEGTYDYRFKGIVKNKSELKKIMQMLEING